MMPVEGVVAFATLNGQGAYSLGAPWPCADATIHPFHLVARTPHRPSSPTRSRLLRLLITPAPVALVARQKSD